MVLPSNGAASAVEGGRGMIQKELTEAPLSVSTLVLHTHPHISFFKLKGCFYNEFLSPFEKFHFQFGYI